MATQSFLPEHWAHDFNTSTFSCRKCGERASFLAVERNPGVLRTHICPPRPSLPFGWRFGSAPSRSAVCVRCQLEYLFDATPVAVVEEALRAHSNSCGREHVCQQGTRPANEAEMELARLKKEIDENAIRLRHENETLRANLRSRDAQLQAARCAIDEMENRRDMYSDANQKIHAVVQRHMSPGEGCIIVDEWLEKQLSELAELRRLQAMTSITVTTSSIDAADIANLINSPPADKFWLARGATADLCESGPGIKARDLPSMKPQTIDLATMADLLCDDAD